VPEAEKRGPPQCHGLPCGRGTLTVMRSRAGSLVRPPDEIRFQKPAVAGSILTAALRCRTRYRLIPAGMISAKQRGLWNVVGWP
jgi:hypothetical protein